MLSDLTLVGLVALLLAGVSATSEEQQLPCADGSTPLCDSAEEPLCPRRIGGFTLHFTGINSIGFSDVKVTGISGGKIGLIPMNGTRALNCSHIASSGTLCDTLDGDPETCWSHVYQSHNYSVSLSYNLLDGETWVRNVEVDTQHTCSKALIYKVSIYGAGEELYAQKEAGGVVALDVGSAQTWPCTSSDIYPACEQGLPHCANGALPIPLEARVLHRRNVVMAIGVLAAALCLLLTCCFCSKRNQKAYLTVSKPGEGDGIATNHMVERYGGVDQTVELETSSLIIHPNPPGADDDDLLEF